MSYLQLDKMSPTTGSVHVFMILCLLIHIHIEAIPTKVSAAEYCFRRNPYFNPSAYKEIGSSGSFCLARTNLLPKRLIRFRRAFSAATLANSGKLLLSERCANTRYVAYPS